MDYEYDTMSMPMDVPEPDGDSTGSDSASQWSSRVAGIYRRVTQIYAILHEYVKLLQWRRVLCYKFIFWCDFNEHWLVVVRITSWP